MVDAVGMKPVSRDLSVARIAAAAPVAAVQAVATPAASSAAAAPAKVAELSGVAQTLAAAPPVDTDRVARIKKAIKDGDFPILPATIADQMIAYKLSWNNK
jgi:negative regulator of flagellin synthesis FlgM